MSTRADDTDQSPAQAPAPFRLLRYYALASLAAVAAAAVLIAWLYDGAALRELIALLAALYAALLVAVHRADRIIRHETARRESEAARLREARDQLARSEQFHRALIERASDAVVVVDEELKIAHAAAAVREVLGRAEAEMLGSPLFEFAISEYREPLEAWLRAVTSQEGAARPIEFEGDHPDRGRRYFVANATNLLADAAVRGVVVNIRDITERKRAEMQARRLALYDELTGLARRDFFADQTRKAIAFAKRFNEHLAILFLDLDGFKRVNDELGHDVGDALLKAVADRVRDTLREGDTIGRYVMYKADDHVARFGGDEFMILLTRLRQPEDAASIARRLLAAVSQPYDVLQQSTDTVTASIGVAVYPEDGGDMEELMKSADAAMYSAKLQGKNTFRLASGA